MNASATVVGSIYGLMAITSAYVLSMIASGLFARAFYRIYARVLIGICSMMMLAPLLKWMTPHPVSTRLLLTLTGYLAVGILAYGVVRFNRDFITTVFLTRRLSAYFIFGTLANATVITLVLLHIAASSSAMQSEVVGVAHYAPLLMLLAGMVFHTDYHLKEATGSPRQLSRFTFMGYGIAFAAILLSGLPYVGQALAALDLAPAQQAFLENFSSAQTLLLAVLIFGALVWRLGSVPPLYVLLSAICAEYYVLVTQWCIAGWGDWRGFGPSVVGIASLPLLAGIGACSGYFVSWDRKRTKRQRIEGSGGATGDGVAGLRVLAPLLVVNWTLVALLVSATLWTRFDVRVQGWSPAWLAATFAAMAIYEAVCAVMLRDTLHVYVAASLLALAAMLGQAPVACPSSILVLAGLSVAWSLLSYIGSMVSLKRDFQAALVDVGMVSGLIAMGAVACRQMIALGGSGPYGCGLTTSVADLASLALAAICLVLVTRQYRSKLPMYGVVLAAILVNPLLGAGMALAVRLAGDLIHMFGTRVSYGRTHAPLPTFNRWALPLSDDPPQLFARPLWEGSLPLALLGLAVSLEHMVRLGLSGSATLGTAVSSLVLGVFTLRVRWRWLYVVSLAGAYLTIHAAACRWTGLPTTPENLARHVLLTTLISLLGWIIASSYATWCRYWLPRIAVEKEASLRQKREFYAGTLHTTTFFIAVAATAWLGSVTGLHYPVAVATPAILAGVSICLAILFGCFGTTYRSIAPLLLSLLTLCLASYQLVGMLSWENRGVYDGVALVAIASACALLSVAIRSIGSAAPGLPGTTAALNAPHPLSATRAAGMYVLWASSLDLASVLLPFAALAHAVSSWSDASTRVWALGTFYLSAAVWLVNTRANREGSLAALSGLVGRAVPYTGAMQVRQTQRAEQIILIVLSIGMSYFAVHATAHAVLFSQYISAQHPLIAWHVVVAGLTSVAGWMIASSFSAWCRGRLQRSLRDEAGVIPDHTCLHGALLYHATVLAAICGLITLLYSVSKGQVAGYERIHFAASMILAASFGLAGAVYRSKLGTYLALVAVSVATATFLAALPVGTLGHTAPGAAWAVLALVAAVVGAVLWSGVTATPRNLNYVPDTPWPGFSLPFTEIDWRRRWAVPLAEYSLLVSFAAIAVVLARLGHPNGVAAVVTFVAAAGVCAVTAWLYRMPLLTYAGVSLLWWAVYMGLARFGLPAHYGGPIVAGLALLVCGTSIAAERIGTSLGRDASPRAVRTSILASVYERPLVQCAVVLALVAVGHAAVSFALNEAIELPLVSSTGAVLTLLLAARSEQCLRRVATARSLVYIACCAASCGVLAAAIITWGPPVSVPAAAGLSLLVAVTGLLLVEIARARDQLTSRSAGLLRLYGEPLARCGLAFPVVAIALGVARSIPAPQAAFVGHELTLALIVASAVYLVSVRATRVTLWLYPSVVFASLGVCAWVAATFPLSVGQLLVVSLLLLNFCVCAARWLRRHRDRVGLLLGVEAINCDKPFYWWPFIATVAILLGAMIWGVAIVIGSAAVTEPTYFWQVAPIVSSLLFFHLLYLERRRIFLHALIGSGFLVTLSLAALSNWAFTPDLALLCSGLFWASIAVMLTRPAGDLMVRVAGFPMEPRERRELAVVAIQWVFGLFFLALAVTVPIWIWMRPAFPSTSVTVFTAVAGSLLASYLGRRNDVWLAPAKALRDSVGVVRYLSEPVHFEMSAAILILPGLWSILTFVSGPAHQLSLEGIVTMLPLAGLATSVLSLVYIAVSRKMRERELTDLSAGTATSGALLNVAGIFILISGEITGIAAVLVEPAIPVAASFLVLSAACLSMAWLRQEEFWVYLAGLVIAAIYLYARHGLLGEPFGPDFAQAFTVIAASFILFGLNIVTCRSNRPEFSVFQRPTFYSALLLPFLLPVVTPYAPESGATLSLLVFAVGAYYALIARRERLSWAAYLSLALFTIAVYLWVPQLSRSTHLLQLYVIPGAISVLCLAHLHRHELNHQTLTSVRYAATGAILAVSSFEARFSNSASLAHFLVVLFLSLSGTIAGISLRVRPFVYVGLAFLIVNVLGQIGLQFQRQSNGLLRAGILIGVGFAVIAIMVYFNVRREQILSKYHNFLGDSQWE